MDTETTIAAMHQFGGGFARALAQAWWAADAQNRARLETAFADMFLRYRAMAELIGSTTP